MATFEYLYIDESGKKKKGKMEAASEDKLITALKAEGKMPIQVLEQNVLTKDINLDLISAVKSKDLAVFCRQFYSILTAGVSIVHAMDMLSNDTENKLLKEAIKKTKASIEKGDTLSQAMSAHTNIFPILFINMMEAGEISGSFENSLLRMAEHFEKEAKLKAVIKKATIYPVIVLFVSVIVVALMLIKVIPNFMSMFDAMEVEMPAVTSVVMKISHVVSKNWVVFLLFILVLIIGLKLLKSSKQGNEYLSRTVLKLPLIGDLIIKSSSARFGRTLSTMLSAGIPITMALEITAKSMSNIIIGQGITDSIKEVERGVSLADTLDSIHRFPPMVSHLIRIGEQSGTTDSMLDKIAEYYEDEVESITGSLIAVLEPFMIIVLAIVVGFLLIAMFQPMITMYQGFDKLG